MIKIAHFQYFISLFVIFFALACTEIPPLVTPAGSLDPCENPEVSRVAGQQKQVLIEEFTGIQCVNCPAGTQAIEDLAGVYGERLVVVSIHTGFFADPYPESSYDFRTTDGDQLAQLLGSPLGYPTAVINRKKFFGESLLQLGRNKWAGHIATELASPRAARLDILSTFDPVTREISASVAVFFDENPQTPFKLSLFVTEDEIVDLQKTPDGIDPVYQHRHVFRDAVSPYNGIDIPIATLENKTFCTQLKTTLSPDWNPGKIYLVAVLSRVGTDIEVVQAAEEKLIP